MWIIAVFIGGLIMWFSLRYAWWRTPVSDQHPRILMYHMVSPHEKGARFNGLRVPPAQFEKQIHWLSSNGWYFATMQELMSPAHALPPRTVAITFDDGYEDNYTQAFPILEKYQAKATLYLVVDRHDNDWSVNKKAHHDSGELARVPKLSDDQVRCMIDSGLVEIGGHTLTHVNLARLCREEKEAEILGCKRALESRFGVTVSSFAYPFGIYHAEDADIVKKAGFTNAVLAEGGIETSRFERPFFLRRVKISGKDNFFAFVCRIRTGKRGWRN